MKQWYAVYTKPGKELLAAENLVRQAFENYLPLTRERSLRRGRWSQHTKPLFPRYLFVHLDVAVENTAAIRSTIGVSNLVRFGLELAVVPARLIDALHAQTDPESGLVLLGEPAFKAGDKVLVMDGPFKGVEGIFQQPNGAHRSMILLELLGRQSPVVVDNDRLTGTR